MGVVANVDLIVWEIRKRSKLEGLILLLYSTARPAPRGRACLSSRGSRALPGLCPGAAVLKALGLVEALENQTTEVEAAKPRPSLSFYDCFHSFSDQFHQQQCK